MADPSNAAGIEAALADLTRQSLSRGELAAHLALTLFASVVFACMAGVAMTSFGHLLRPAWSFWVLLAIAGAWIGFGLRVLSPRRPLLAYREAAVAWFLVLLTALFTAAAMAVGWEVARRPYTPLATDGLVVLAIAIANLLRATWRRRRLHRLRLRLEHELAQSPR